MHNWAEYVRKRLPALPVRPEREADIVRELAEQMEQAYADAIAGGASEREAVVRAEAQFPDWSALAREISAAERHAPEAAPPGSPFTGWRQDLRSAARMFRGSPSLTAAALLTLAFGIGANTAVFTVFDHAILRPLRFPEPQRLMAVETHKQTELEGEAWTSAPDFFDIRERSRSFESVAGITPAWSMVMTGRGPAERVRALFVSAAFFPMLGAQPALGRFFGPAEDAGMHGANVVVLSHSMWRRRFGGDAGVVGRAVTLDGRPWTVVGVLPAGFRYSGEALAGKRDGIDIYAPLAANRLTARGRSLRFLKVIARLRAGVDARAADAEVRGIGAGLAAAHPESNRGYVMGAASLQQRATKRLRGPMLLALWAVGFVLLIACTNVASLLLARAAARTREIAVRMALGASGWRLARQLAVEAMALAIAGGVAGALAGYGLLRALLAAAPEDMLAPDIALDGRAFLFTAAAVVAAGLGAALPPALRIARSDLAPALGQTSRAVTGSHRGLRSALVASQMAIAVVLLIGSALLIRSFVRVLAVDPGFDARGLITVSTQMPAAAAQSPEQRFRILERLRARLLELPGVTEVGAVSRIPMSGATLTSWIAVEGKPVREDERPEVEYRTATPSYFRTMGIPILRGRAFDDRDNRAPGTVVVVNEAAAKRFWPGEDPVGKHVKFGLPGENSPWVTVIGVCGSVRHFGLEEKAPEEVYRPYANNPLYAPIIVARVKGDAGAAVSEVSSAIRALEPDMPVYNAHRMEELVSESTAQRRFLMLLLSVFAGMAVMLAAVGLYGVASETVAQRTGEIGVRMALGASGGQVLRMVLRQNLTLAAMGAAAGCGGAAALTQLMGAMLYSVEPLDPVAFAAGPAVLAAAAAVAAYAPARRATRVDPLAALRAE
jgi:predicted permease